MKLKEYILNTFNQEIIFSKYLNIPIEDISFCIYNRGAKIRNTLRHDVNPCLSFRYYGNKLIARDFWDTRYRGDIFEIVGIILNKNCNNPLHFNQICEDIINTCQNINNEKIRYTQHEEDLLSKKDQLVIDILPRRFNTFDYEFFIKQGLNKKVIDNYIQVVHEYRLNNWKAKYHYSIKDPCYAYIVNPNCYKLYFPYRSKRDKKFITNNHCPIECLNTIKETEYKIITKSIKDKLLFIRILDQLEINNVQVLSTASETSKLNKELLDLLNNTTSKKIFSIFDLDKTGIESMRYYKENYNIEPLYFTEGYTSSKDPTDMVKSYGYTKVLKRFEELYKNHILCY